MSLQGMAREIEEIEELFQPMTPVEKLALGGKVRSGSLPAASKKLSVAPLFPRMSLKTTLEHIDPALDKDEAFVATLQRFERAFRRSRRLFLEPDNLA